MLPLRSHILNVEESSSRSTLQSEVGVGLASYSGAMNNPWSSLIAALSGTRVSTPSAWPVRKVHRLGDVCPARSAGARLARQPHQRGLSPSLAPR